MKNILFIFISTIIVINSINLFAQTDRWVYYSDKSADETTGKFYYDINTIEYNNDNTITLWIKYILNEKTYVDFMNKYNDYTLMQIKLLCGVSAHVLTYVEPFYTDGSSGGGFSTNSYRIVKPETQIEVLYNMFCK